MNKKNLKILAKFSETQVNLLSEEVKNLKQAKKPPLPKPTSSVNYGGKTDYYRLLDTDHHLEDIIKAKGMSHAQGEAFCALYRLNEKDTIERNLNKVAHNVAFMQNKPAPLSLLQIGEEQYSICERNNWHNKTPLEYLALIASEVGEAVNEVRGETPTEKLGEELADIILRVCDFSIVQGISLEEEVKRKLKTNKETEQQQNRKK